MRIAMLCLHTSPLEQPGAGDAGGMNVYVKNLAFALGALGHQVHLVTRTAELTRTEEVRENVWIHYLQVAPGQTLSKEQLPGIIPEAVTAAAQHLAEFTFDVIHAHYWLSGMLGLHLAQTWQVPLVLSMHTSAAAKEYESGIAEPVVRKHSEKTLLAAATRVIANTPVEARQLTRFYALASSKLDVVLPGVDHRIFHPTQDKLRRPEGSDDLHVVYAGRMQKLKGAHLLIAAIGQALHSHPELKITADLYGALSGAADYDLPAMVAAAGLAEQVAFHAPLSPEGLATVFANADVVAVPSLSETFGLVAAEAQACGTPVIANQVGGLNYAVHDQQSGWLMPQPDAEIWAEQLVKLALHPGLISRAGHAALEHSAKFTWERAAVEALASYRLARQDRNPLPPGNFLPN